MPILRNPQNAEFSFSDLAQFFDKADLHMFAQVNIHKLVLIFAIWNTQKPMVSRLGNLRTEQLKLYWLPVGHQQVPVSCVLLHLRDEPPIQNNQLHQKASKHPLQ